VKQSERPLLIKFLCFREFNNEIAIHCTTTEFN
jgi:hypothetical protein